MPRDANFSEPTREIIAKRAGFRCSFPGCGKTTVGPGQKSDEVDSSGIAAHILAASVDGPRGSGGLNAEERKHPKNGIWMCSSHSTLIDANTGKRYPDGVIQRWKASHEARIDHEHHRLPVPFGWMSQLIISTSPLFVPATVIDFGKVTLLYGNNGTGKTAVCDWLLAMLGGMEHGCRWMHRLKDRDAVCFRLNYSTPDPHSATGVINTNIINCKIDDKLDALDLSHSFAAISLQKEFRFDGLDDLADIANALDVHRQRIAQAIPFVATLSLPFVKQLVVQDVAPQDDDDDENDNGESPIDKRALHVLGITTPQELKVQIGTHSHPVGFTSLSGRELSITVISIAIALAHLRSLHIPTVLIIDLGAQCLPDGLLQDYATLLTEARFGFQTIFVSPAGHKEINWAGWSVARFNGTPPNVVVSQSPVQ